MSSGSKDTDGEVAAPPIGLSTDYKLLMHSCELFLGTSFGSFSCDLRRDQFTLFGCFIF